MPELPEVETVVRRLRKAVLGRKIQDVWAAEDPLVLKGRPTAAVVAHLKDRTVEEVGRKGKYFWLRLDDGSSLLAHFGMSGWMEEVGPGAERPKFAKLDLSFEGGIRFAYRDGRRLGRLWFAEDPLKDPTIAELGFDVLTSLPKPADLERLVGKRNTSIKAVLLDQGVFAGVGNYIADEALYQAKISPKRLGSDLTKAEVGRLRKRLLEVVETAVNADADEDRFPEGWLFHHRWGGKRGAEKIGKHAIVRETVAGRTTAWVPSVQK